MSIQNFTYLIIDLGCIFIPFIASFYSKKPFYKELKFFIPANIFVGLLFVVWDHFFTKAGVWGFNSDYLTGLFIGALPIEEILFFFCIPYACVFTWFAIQYLFDRKILENSQSVISALLGVVLLLIGIASYERLYTFITFLSTGIYLLMIFLLKINISWIYVSFVAIVPFFLVSNGLLTGTWLDAPIVWYNNAENLGIRVGSIPIEDAVYGFLLIMMNINLYQYLKILHKKRV
nr:lycopene cyclase domain-containing protein [uncultured Carboxylicivirga sp.]